MATNYYAANPYVVSQNFDRLADFTIAGSPTTSEITASAFTEGYGAWNVTASASAATADYTISQKWSTADPVRGLLRIYLPVGSNITSVLLYLSTSAGFGAGTWASATLAAYEGVRDQAAFKSGWTNLLFTRSSFAGGTPTLLDNSANTFTTVRVRAEANKGPVYFDALYFGGPSSAQFMMMFDDAHESIMTVNDAVFGTGKSAADYLQDNNIPATIYVASDLIDTAGYLTTAQLTTLYNRGWDLGNHTKTHVTLTTLTDNQISAEVEACDKILVTNGWTRARKHFAYPTGAFTLDTHPALLKKMGFLTARSIQATLLNTQYNPDNMHHLWAKGVGTGVTAANMTDKVDEAVASGRMFGAYIHALNASESSYNWDPAKFKTLVDYVVTKRAAGLISAKTISQWYDGLVPTVRRGGSGGGFFGSGF